MNTATAEPTTTGPATTGPGVTPPPKPTPAASLPPKTLTTYQPLRAFTYSMDYGAVLALRTWSVSFTQSWSSALMRGLYNHEFGNITLYVGL